jgi:hypothetical protein
MLAWRLRAFWLFLTLQAGEYPNAHSAPFVVAFATESRRDSAGALAKAARGWRTTLEHLATKGIFLQISQFVLLYIIII